MHLLFTARGRWLGAALAVLWLSCCLRVETYPAGTDRATVYAIMGTPSNLDDARIAVWSRREAKTKARVARWRDLCNDDEFVAVFDEHDRTLLPKISFSATSIYPDVSDEEIVRQVRATGIPGGGYP